MHRLLALALAGLLLSACAPRFVLDRGDEPLRESVLSGRGAEKVLLVNLRGMISDAPSQGLFRKKPSLVEETVAQLKMAEKDQDVRALVLLIESPGGTTAASDILYHEIAAYKARTKVPVVACFLGLAASGAYYAALPAERIVAHPTTVTGSVGTIFLQPKVMGLMDKVGVEVEAYTSGAHKDMASMFREATPEEKAMINSIIADLNGRFLALVKDNRRLSEAALAEVATARVFSAPQALTLGLVDSIGYVDDAIKTAKELAGLPEEATVIAYRRADLPDDTVYNPYTAQAGGEPLRLVDLGLSAAPATGFYFLWTPGQ